MELRECTDLSDATLAPMWDEVEVSTQAGLFGTRLWVQTWFRHFGDGLTPAVVVGLKEGRPVALAPLFGTPSYERVLPVNFLSPRAEFLVKRQDAPRFVATLMSWFRERGVRLSLRGLPAESDTAQMVRSFAHGTKYLHHSAPSRVSPFVEIAGSWDDYLAGRPRKVTHEWERKMRKLERAGDVRVLQFEEGMDAGRLVDEFAEVERRSWKEEAGTSMRARGSVRFHREIAEALARCGEFHPLWLELDGRVVAFLYGAVHAGTYYAMKTSYDTESANLSPGVRLFHEAIGHSFGAGLAYFDFLGERARWKDEWATGWREHVNVRLYPNTSAGKWAHLRDSKIKPLLRRVRGGRKAG
jgi:CelD/BcsL family acetyltransferase involved in cellulose biosynthesis